MSKRLSRGNFEISSVKNLNQKKWLSKKPSSTDEPKLYNMYQLQKPIYLDDSTVT